MRFEKIWRKQWSATKGIERRFGAKGALDYLIGEKLFSFAEEAERRPEFASELPRFLAAIWQMFNQYELAGYVASQKPAARKKLRKLLYLHDSTWLKSSGSIWTGAGFRRSAKRARRDARVLPRVQFCYPEMFLR